MTTDADFSLIAIVSPKGGVGKTTLTANLAIGLRAMGHEVLVLDLDPQNALRLHFQLPFDDVGGYAVQSLNGEPWSNAQRLSATGIRVLPFGALDEMGLARFEAQCAADNTWLSRGVQSLALAPHTLVLVDTPPGSGPINRQLLPQVNGVLCVLLPEVTSFVTLGLMERWLETYCSDPAVCMLGAYVMNAVTEQSGLESEVITALVDRVGSRMAPQQIRRSDAVRESFASAQALPDYAPLAEVNHDYQALAQWLVTQI